LRFLRIRNYASGGFAACVLLLPAVCSAQQYFDPGLFQKAIEQKPEDFRAPGARLGSFMLRPGVEVVFESNDNIFYLSDQEIDDTVWHVRPWASLASDWTRHALNVSAWGDIARYQDYDVQDYEDWAVRADGRIDVRRESYLSYEVSAMRLHEDRRSPDDRFGIRPSEFDYRGFGGGYDHSFNRLKAGVYYRQMAFDYHDNVDGEGNIIDNQDRDREQGTLTLRADYQWQPERALFVSYAWNEVDYDRPVDRNGFQRSSDGNAISAGIVFDMTGVLVGDLYGTFSEQQYDDPELLDVDGFSVGAGLRWTPTLKTLLHLRFAGGPQETTQPGTSGYFSQLWSLRLQHELRRNLLFSARVSYTDNNYEATRTEETTLRDTQVTRAGIGLSYLFNRNVSLAAGYTLESQDANNPNFEYDANRLFLVLGLEL